MENKSEIDKVINVIEPVLFTNLSEENVNNSRLSSIATIIMYVAIDYGLNPAKHNDFKTIKRIIINSVKNN